MFVRAALLVVAVTSVVTSEVDYGTDVDYGTVVDKLLEETRAKIPDSVSFTELHYEQKSWDAVDERFNVVARLDGVNGQLKLECFKRDGAPRVRGTTDDLTLETKFTIGLSVTYDNFTADNFTSGEASHGRMSVSYDKAEIRTAISIKRDSTSCSSSVESFLPTALSEPSASVNSTVTDLPLRLFSLAESTLNFYLNRTLVTEGLPTFAGVVAGSDLCSFFS